MNSQAEIDSLVDHVLSDSESSDLKNLAGTTVLDHSSSSQIVCLTDPTGLAVERYRLISRKLVASNPDGGVVLITSPSAGDGKTLTSTNMAWCIAGRGKNVCLVDLDLRAPALSLALGFRPIVDVVEVLEGHRNLSESIGRVEESSLYVIGNSRRLAAPQKLISAEILSPLVSQLKASFEWVILDMPPAVPMADVAEVLPLTDGALMVVRSGSTPKSLINPTLEILGKKLWGVVLNDCVVHGGGYYGKSGYYGSRKLKK